MKIQALRELTRGELLQQQRDLQEELFNLKMRKSMKQLENPLKLRHLGRQIAQVLTVLREDELGVRKLAEGKASILGDTAAKKAKNE